MLVASFEQDTRFEVLCSVSNFTFLFLTSAETRGAAAHLERERVHGVSGTSLHRGFCISLHFTDSKAPLVHNTTPVGIYLITLLV
jgi:hypothetical protein